MLPTHILECAAAQVAGEKHDAIDTSIIHDTLAVIANEVRWLKSAVTANEVRGLKVTSLRTK